MKAKSQPMVGWSVRVGRKKLYLFATIFLLIAGVLGVCLGPTVRPLVRTWYYHQWAKDFEADWDCVDVLGIREVPNSPELMAVVVEVDGLTMSCGSRAGVDFTKRIPKVMKVARLLGARVKYPYVCARDDTWPKGICSNGWYFLPYPAEYDMWPGKGE